MKRILLVAAVAILMIGCSKDDDNTQSINVEKFVGTYIGLVSWQNDNAVQSEQSTFALSVNPTDKNGLMLYNIGNLGQSISVKLTVNPDLSVSIPHQIVDVDGEQIGIVGSGELSNGRVEFTYLETAWGYVCNVSVVGIKN